LNATLGKRFDIYTRGALTVMTVYQQADQVTIRNALTNRDQRRAIGTR
jgi:hypothetical protein